MGDVHIETEALFIVILPQANINSVSLCYNYNGFKVYKWSRDPQIYSKTVCQLMFLYWVQWQDDALRKAKLNSKAHKF